VGSNREGFWQSTLIPHIAPEVLNGDGYDSKVDLWSLGVVVYIMYVSYMMCRNIMG
jgi:serine/threonine protein kinase